VVAYSVIILSYRVVKKALNINKRVDPLNSNHLEEVLGILYYVTLFLPMIMMWHLYEVFSPTKVVLVAY
jgi:hypothetical protein